MVISEIIDALKALDHDNDEHWTLDGAPRLDVLEKQFAGITRQQVQSVAPLFGRNNPDLPDLAKLREEAAAAMKESESLAAKAVEAAQVAKVKAAAVLALEQSIKDSHTLTRQNQAWIESQNKTQLERLDRQRYLDGLVKSAGGLGQIGRHPLERNEAARIRAKRRNITLPVGK